MNKLLPLILQFLLTACAGSGIVLDRMVPNNTIYGTAFDEIANPKFPIDTPVHGNFDSSVRVLSAVDPAKEADQVKNAKGYLFIKLQNSELPEGIDRECTMRAWKRRFRQFIMPGTSVPRTEESELYLDTAKEYALKFNERMRDIWGGCKNGESSK